MTTLQPDGTEEAGGPTLEQALGEATAAVHAGDLARAEGLARAILERTPGSVAAQNALAAVLGRSGRIAAEIAARRAEPARNGGDADRQALLGEFERVAGNPAAAIEALEAATALKPDDAALWVNLGRARFDAGDFEGAEGAFRRAAEIAPQSSASDYFLCDASDFVAGEPAFRRAAGNDAGFPLSHQFVGDALLSVGRAEDAIRAYSRAVEADPDSIPACLRLAELLHTRERSAQRAQERSPGRVADLERALGLVERARRLGADDPAGLLLAGQILLGLGRYGEARQVLEPALALPRRHPDLYVALSVAYARTGEDEKARNVSARLLREFPVGSRPSPRPEARALVLEFLGHRAFMEPLFGIHAYAHTNTIGLVPAHRVSFDHAFMEGVTRERAIRFAEDYDVVFNNVVNAELSISRGYGTRIRRILEETKLPVVNDPGRVELTLRHVNYARLRHIEHMIFPRTMLLDLRETGEEDAIKRIASEFAFPVLLRRAGTNRASTLVKAEDAESLRAALGPLGGGPVYVIQFHESRHRSGNFLMYRGIFVGGRFHPGRMYMADGWLVSGPAQRSLERTLIEASPELQEEEMAWLADPEGAVGAENLAAFHAMHEVIGLDCYGFDFGIAGDGRAIVFEANATMNLLSIRRHVPKFPYLAPAADAIARAIEDLIVARASEGRART